MTWNLRKPNVTLRVRPVREWDARPKSNVVAGLTPDARKVYRARRERECAKVATKVIDKNPRKMP